MDDDVVTITTRDGSTATMHAREFIRRFLLHVLPKGFVKIRYYGLMASSNVKTKLEQARALLERQGRSPEPGGSDASCSQDDWRRLLVLLTGVDLAICPACGSNRGRRVPVPRRRNPSRNPPIHTGRDP